MKHALGSPTRIGRYYAVGLRVFAGKKRLMLQQRHNERFFRSCIFSPSLCADRQTQCVTLRTKGAVMPIRKAIATLASVTAAACGLFAFSWVGLALLGF
jgi:hypothetical protein